MQQINILFIQVAVMIILAAIGYVAGKSGYLPDNTSTYLSRIVIRITAPALILSTMTSYSFDAKTLSNGLWVGLFGLLFMLFGLMAGTLFSRLMKLKGATANVFRTHCIFGNVSYLGLPFFKALLGDKAMIIAVFFVLSFELLNWTLGIYLLNSHKTLSLKALLKKFVNANTIACLTGLIFALTNLQQTISANAAARTVYNVFYSALNPLGGCTFPLVMLFVGLSTAENSKGGIKSFFKKPITLMLTLLKLVLLPLATLAVMLLLGGWVDPLVRTIVIMDTAMPCAAITVALSAEYGSDYVQATDNVVYTTLLSLFTLPLFMLIVNSL